MVAAVVMGEEGAVVGIDGAGLYARLMGGEPGVL